MTATAGFNRSYKKDCPLYIFEKEQNHLISQGKIKQSKEIIHVSPESDSEGYDIISFTDNGDRKYIEVKTTTGNE